MDFINTHFKLISAALGVVIVILAVIIFSGLMPASESADSTGLQEPDSQQTAPGSQEASQGGTKGEGKLADGALNGAWTSSEDAKLVRTFNADGTVTDTVKGRTTPTQKGTYAIVNPSTVTGAQVPAAQLTGQIILKVTFPAGTTYYSVNSMSRTAFEATNVSVLSGKNITFTRVQ
ncbi:hypothetical protein K8R03_01535 [Candidatus Kaiserbacteria bacterium]|nr:hypothetical protein [Candidatus Kaiserbacteria bacterium]